jgi:hypothetical protein
MNCAESLTLMMSLLVVCSCGGASPTHPMATCDDVARPLSPPTQDQTIDPMVLDFHIEALSPPVDNLVVLRLRNIGDGPLWVNARMHVSSEESSFREVWLTLAHSGGSTLFPECRGGAGYANPTDYVLLTPKSEISVVRSLSCVLPGDGTWAITAHYQDTNKRVPRPPRGAVWFGGTLLSNEIEFHSKPLEGPQSAR